MLRGRGARWSRGVVKAGQDKMEQGNGKDNSGKDRTGAEYGRGKSRRLLAGREASSAGHECEPFDTVTHFRRNGFERAPFLGQRPRRFCHDAATSLADRRRHRRRRWERSGGCSTHDNPAQASLFPCFFFFCCTAFSDTSPRGWPSCCSLYGSSQPLPIQVSSSVSKW